MWSHCHKIFVQGLGLTSASVICKRTQLRKFFHHVGLAKELEKNDDNDEEVRELTTHLVPKQTSYRELISCLENVLCFLNNVVTLILQMPYHE